MKRDPRKSVRSFPAPRPVNFGRYGWCKWCGLAIPQIIDGKKSTQRMWHPECVHEYNLHTRSESQKRFLIKRDGQRCAICQAAPTKWLHDQYPHREFVESRRFYTPKPDDLAKLWNDPFPGIGWSSMTPTQRMCGEYYRVWQECALEVDHRVPLWKVANLPDDERRQYFGPTNLWLLCPSCHLTKTKAESAERATARRAGT